MTPLFVKNHLTLIFFFFPLLFWVISPQTTFYFQSPYTLEWPQNSPVHWIDGDTIMVPVMASNEYKKIAPRIRLMWIDAVEGTKGPLLPFPTKQRFFKLHYFGPDFYQRSLGELWVASLENPSFFSSYSEKVLREGRAHLYLGEKEVRSPQKKLRKKIHHLAQLYLKAQLTRKGLFKQSRTINPWYQRHHKPSVVSKKIK